ncbi:hypothetical protein NDU88_004544 [Pleurodeles waltl]|uniref:Uncharacterized protein n=1 Tax=Pleurodeles waltl TaxID=8319 RepID=A0AAV7M839_PLEWA|nr:hypothetical protein NDU88_004544 [Pleurodeles waltl]
MTKDKPPLGPKQNTLDQYAQLSDAVQMAGPGTPSGTLRHSGTTGCHYTIKTYAQCKNRIGRLRSYLAMSGLAECGRRNH